MPTKAQLVVGATSEWGTDGTTYTNIAEARSIVVPVIQPEYVDATSLDSTGGFREFVAGLSDPGEITIPANYTPDIYALAETYRAAGNAIFFRTTMPVFAGQSTADTFVFQGLVTPSLETNAVGEIIAMNILVRVSGAVTYTKGTDA